MGVLVEGVWRDEQHGERAPTGRFLPASPPRAGAITSTWRTPARGRIAR